MRKVFIYMRYKIGDTWKGGGKTQTEKWLPKCPSFAPWPKKEMMQETEREQD